MSLDLYLLLLSTESSQKIIPAEHPRTFTMTNFLNELSDCNTTLRDTQ